MLKELNNTDHSGEKSPLFFVPLQQSNTPGEHCPPARAAAAFEQLIIAVLWRLVNRLTIAYSYPYFTLIFTLYPLEFPNTHKHA